MGTWKSGYVTVSPNEVIESKTLPLQTSAQKAELVALMRVSQLGKYKKLNIFTDSKYESGNKISQWIKFLNMNSMCYIIMLPFGKRKNGGILTAKNFPIKHKDLILALLEAVQLPTQVAVIHCWGHQREESLWAKGTAKLIKRQNR